MNASKNAIKDIADEFVDRIERVVRDRVLEQIQRVVKNPGTSPKRTERLIDEAKEQILKAIKAHPGSRSEEIQKLVGMNAALLALPLKQLVETKALKFKGVARGRRYWIR